MKWKNTRSRGKTLGVAPLHLLTLAIKLQFGPFRRECLFYIWTILFVITVHTFAVVVISLYTRKYAILLHLAWISSKKLGFTLFLLYSHKGWTAALVCDSVYSLPDSRLSLLSIQSTVSCTSATSCNYDATITFLTAQQWTSDATTIIISCSAICTQPRPVTSLEHQGRRRIFWEWSRIFKIYPTHFCTGLRPLWLRAWLHLLYN